MKTLIKNGRVLDPANQIDGELNILVKDERIAHVYAPDLSSAADPFQREADHTIDARGCMVAPGFIDIHMHEDPVSSDDTIAQCIFPAMARMGVTTVLAGNCGDNFCDPVHYLSLVKSQGTAVNVAMLAGHDYFRNAAGAHEKYAPATPSQIQDMQDMISRALTEGCMGISFGLRYVPGMTMQEYLSIASCAAGEHRLVAAHVRDDAAFVFDAFEEFAAAAKQWRIPLQFSHIGSMGGYGQMKRLLAMLDAYRSQGLDIMADCYPYDAFSTQIGASTYDEGWLERYHCDYNAVELCEGAYAGMRCTKQLFEQIRIQQPDMLTVGHVMQPEDIQLALTHPAVMLGSDGTLHNGQGHPRAAGAFPRLLGSYARKGALSFYACIEKMSSMPARRLGLKQKGTLKVGADADIVVFDPEKVCDQATFLNPMAPPKGICHVLIGGTCAVREGTLLNDRLGTAVFYRQESNS